MQFYVVEPSSRDTWPREPEAILIHRAYWNDWYQWKTLFYAYVVGPDGEALDVGAVKIAKLNFSYVRSHETNGDLTPLPKKFSGQLREVVSVGQDESYYLNLRNHLGPKKMKLALRQVGDLALDRALFERTKHKSVVQESLLRSVASVSVTGVFARIIKTGLSQVAYDFRYLRNSENPEVNEPARFEFAVVPNSSPPTNVHVLIGRNGAGKTTVMRSMAAALLDTRSSGPDSVHGWFESSDEAELEIANVVYVAFSAFDEAVVPVQDLTLQDRTYSYVGLQYTGSKEADPDDQTNMRQEVAGPTRTRTRTVSDLGRVFASSAMAVVREKSRELWKTALTNLESDPIFNDADVAALAELPLTDEDDEAAFKRSAMLLYRRLSSGHKIVLLTVTKLVQTVTEKTLVLLDEPEGHLHPPLLSAFIRTLSDLMTTRNGIAIVATHSPVILQEVPKSCVLRVMRSGDLQTVERLDTETFGENVGALTSTVFGLEVTESGFHRLLIRAAERLGSYEQVLEEFNNELGFEGRAVLRAWFAGRSE